MALRGLRVARRAVLLDALGTLVQLEPPAPRLRAELRSRFGLELTLAEAERAIGAEIAYYRAHQELGRDEAGLARLRDRCAAVLSAELRQILGRGAPEGRVMVEALLASLSFSAFADAPPVLRELHELGLRLVVVSNWDVSLGEVLDRLGLREWLDGVVASAEIGSAKPSPPIFEQALAIAGVSASEAVHVGDSLREDIQGARSAGIEPVLIRRGSAAAHPGDGEPVTIASLRELPALVCAADG